MKKSDSGDLVDVRESQLEAKIPRGVSFPEFEEAGKESFSGRSGLQSCSQFGRGELYRPRVTESSLWRWSNGWKTVAT